MVPIEAMQNAYIWFHENKQHVHKSIHESSFRLGNGKMHIIIIIKTSHTHLLIKMWIEIGTQFIMCICWKESLAQRAAHSNHINKISNDDVDNIAYNIFHLRKYPPNIHTIHHLILNGCINKCRCNARVLPLHLTNEHDNRVYHFISTLYVLFLF